MVSRSRQSRCLSCWIRGIADLGRGCLSLVFVLWLASSATGWSLVRGSPSGWVGLKACEIETSTWRSSRPRNGLLRPNWLERQNWVFSQDSWHISLYINNTTWSFERRKYSKATAIRKELPHGRDVAREKIGGEGGFNIPFSYFESPRSPNKYFEFLKKIIFLPRKSASPIQDSEKSNLL